MITLSEHSINRGWERFGLLENELENLALLAFYLGLSIEEVPDELAKTRQSMIRIKENATGYGEKLVLLFDKKIFLFKNNVLVTVTKIDKRELKKNE